jgi:hypothetical protein
MTAARGHGAPTRHCAHEKAGKKGGKRAGDDVHLHMELRQRAGATERWWQDGGVPELGGEAGAG